MIYLPTSQGHKYLNKSAPILSMYLHKWSTKKTWKYTTDIQDKPLY